MPQVFLELPRWYTDPPAPATICLLTQGVRQQEIKDKHEFGWAKRDLPARMGIGGSSCRTARGNSSCVRIGRPEVSLRPVDVFLARGGQGPEHQALSAALAGLSTNDAHSGKSGAEISEQVDRVLGQTVVRCWSKLAPEVQATLFEAAVQAEGETIRQILAMHLHDRHDRTLQSVKDKATPEPDSLGG
jgi:hypothetical protein